MAVLNPVFLFTVDAVEDCSDGVKLRPGTAFEVDPEKIWSQRSGSPFELRIPNGEIIEASMVSCQWDDGPRPDDGKRYFITVLRLQRPAVSQRLVGSEVWIVPDPRAKSVNLPIFDDPPDDTSWMGRWRFLCKLAERWHRLPGACEKLELALSEQLVAPVLDIKEQLPPAICLWNALVLGNNRLPIRDDPALRVEPEYQAIAIMDEGEGGFFWGVRVADLKLPDPPVWMFVTLEDYMDSDASNIRLCSTSISQFLFEYLLMYTTAAASGHIRATEEWLSEMRREYVQEGLFCGIHFFEKPGYLCAVQRGNAGYYNVAVMKWNEHAPFETPGCLQDLKRDAGSLLIDAVYGM